VHPGEEWFGLGRSFLLAGADAVVAAQWDVEDAPTSRLMAAFYARLAGGTPLAAALAQAQAERHLGGAHPLDWAAFVALAGPGALAGGSVMPDRQRAAGGAAGPNLLKHGSFQGTRRRREL
jgi:hypothetical protein